MDKVRSIKEMHSAILKPIKVKVIDNTKAGFRCRCLHQSNFNNINSEKIKEISLKRPRLLSASRKSSIVSLNSCAFKVQLSNQLQVWPKLKAANKFSVLPLNVFVMNTKVYKTNTKIQQYQQVLVTYGDDSPICIKINQFRTDCTEFITLLKHNYNCSLHNVAQFRFCTRKYLTRPHKTFTSILL